MDGIGALIDIFYVSSAHQQFLVIVLGNICWHKNNISKKIRSVRLCAATVKSDRKSPDVFNYLRSFPDYTNFILSCTLSQQDYIFLSVCSLFIIERLFKKFDLDNISQAKIFLTDLRSVLNCFSP